MIFGDGQQKNQSKVLKALRFRIYYIINRVLNNEKTILTNMYFRRFEMDRSWMVYDDFCDYAGHPDHLEPINHCQDINHETSDPFGRCIGMGFLEFRHFI